MAELAETMDQGACPVKYAPAGDSTGIKVMSDRGDYDIYGTDCCFVSFVWWGSESNLLSLT